MKAILQKLANKLLSKVGKRIISTPHYQIKGLDIGEDLTRLIPGSSPICFDVGANVGQTIKLLIKCLENPTIYAFEPSSHIHNQLQQTISKNLPKSSKVLLHKLALGKEEGALEFRNYANSLLSSLLPLAEDKRNPFLRDSSQVSNIEKVEVTTLDRFVETTNIQAIDLLKIDTQGFDLNVLEGAKETLASGKIKNVFLEMNFCPLYEGQGTPSQIIDFLAKYNFQIVDIYEKYRSYDTPHMSWCSGLFSLLK